MGKFRNPFFDEKFTGWFDNYKFFINPETNEIEIKYICNDCKTIMTHDQMLKGQYSINVPSQGAPFAYHTAKFWCKDCALKRKAECDSNG